MGQAKQRGTFEQRQAEGIAKQNAEDRRRKEERAVKLSLMTPEGRKREREFQEIMATMAAFMTRFRL